MSDMPGGLDDKEPGLVKRAVFYMVLLFVVMMGVVCIILFMFGGRPPIL